MQRQDAIQEIRGRWRELYKPDRKNKGIICPLCGSGAGPHGTGITANEKGGKPGSLKCWSCGFTGDVFDLYQQETGADFNAAFEWAAGQLGINVEPGAVRREAPPTPQLQKAEPEPPADYTEFIRQSWDKLTDPEAISYLQARGISVETAAAYGVGFCPDWISQTVIKNLEAKGSTWRPDPTARIIIPTWEGHYIARATNPKTKKEKEYAKMNEGSPRLFNAAALQGPEPVFVTEGPFDALSILEAGGSALSLNSTSNTALFLQAVAARDTLPPIILCQDKDEAGARAAAEIASGLEARGVAYITADISGEQKDPNEALQVNREAFFRRVTEAKNRAAQLPRTTQERQEAELARFEALIQGETFRPYETGLSFFDNLLGGGVIRQTLLLLVAAPGAGKTTLCQQLAEKMAGAGKPVIYLNLEMSKEQMLAKAISARLARNAKARVSAIEVLQGYNWTEEQRGAILAEIEDYKKEILPYLQYNPAGQTGDLDRLLEYLEAVGQEAKAAGNEAPVVFVDYLHLLRRPGAEVQEVIKAAVAGLKEYAIKYNSFAVGIIASNRASNATGRLTMESGRDSSALEYTADYQLSLNYYEIDKGEISPSDPEEVSKLQLEPWRRMIIRVLKSRYTAPGKVARVYFHAAHNTFFGENDFMPVDRDRVPFSTGKETDSLKRY